LNRLATAQTVTNPSVTQWGQSYTLLEPRTTAKACALDDGFGNVTDQNVITRKRKQPSAPPLT
jgi:hypothetical protein